MPCLPCHPICKRCLYEIQALRSIGTLLMRWPSYAGPIHPSRHASKPLLLYRNVDKMKHRSNKKIPSLQRVRPHYKNGAIWQINLSYKKSQAMGGEAMRLSFMVKVVPCPALLSTSSQPSCDSRIVCTMDNPNPVPSGLLV